MCFKQSYNLKFLQYFFLIIVFIFWVSKLNSCSFFVSNSYIILSLFQSVFFWLWIWEARLPQVLWALQSIRLRASKERSTQLKTQVRSTTLNSLKIGTSSKRNSDVVDSNQLVHSPISNIEMLLKTIVSQKLVASMKRTVNWIAALGSTPQSRFSMKDV